MSRVLVIGCGGVAGVAIRKCCQVSEVFTELCIASRTKEKCDRLAADLDVLRQAVDQQVQCLFFFAEMTCWARSRWSCAFWRWVYLFVKSLSFFFSP